MDDPVLVPYLAWALPGVVLVPVVSVPLGVIAFVQAGSCAGPGALPVWQVGGFVKLLCEVKPIGDVMLRSPSVPTQIDARPEA
eukprot:1914473-Heterocapsa_arctica.AAC.2